MPCAFAQQLDPRGPGDGGGDEGGGGGSALVNVNNRLVPETWVLNDGDFVILAREKMQI